MRTLEWLAGLCEGEASFSWTRPKGKYGYPTLAVGMLDRDILEQVATMFERNVTTRQMNGRPFYTAALSGQPAIDMMRRLLPWLGLRRAAKVHELCARWNNRPGHTGRKKGAL